MEPMMIELSGAQGSGKTTVAHALSQRLLSLGALPTLFDDGQRQVLSVIPLTPGMYNHINITRVTVKYFGSASETQMLRHLVERTMLEDFGFSVDGAKQGAPFGLSGARVIIKVQEAL